MTKVVEITNYRTEKFTLTRAELVAALTEKYGDEAIFSEGRIYQTFCQTLFHEAGNFENTEVEFRVDQA
ncbi:hypothetical protein [Pseudomonas sp. O230]|uniref:hypothetical protein n=1 Tax=Pseudomonas sp. O230 TaxID=3159450 RepID=UPI00387B41DE